MSIYRSYYDITEFTHKNSFAQYAHPENYAKPKRIENKLKTFRSKVFAKDY